MYSESRILQKLGRFREKYGWQPVAHSVADVIAMNSYIKSLNEVDPNSGIPYFNEAKLTPELKRWIDNERAMSAIDCGYYLTRYHFISADNNILRFAFRSGQKVFYRVCQMLEEEGKSIRIQTLKARQQGISTLVEGMITHRALFVPGVKCSVASADALKTEVMLGMMYTALEHLPWWLPPKTTKDRRSGAALLEFGRIGSSVVIQSGSMRGGIGQGTTPTAVHLSEVCDYTNPVVQIEEGLFKAIHSSPEIFVVLESTGNGSNNWWAELWKENKESWILHGRAQLVPLFIPWFMTPELFPTKTWIHENPINPHWVPMQETIAMTAKCEAYARNTKLIRESLPADWHLPLEQRWYWEVKYIDHRRRRQERSWFRQMPCDDLEALMGENDAIFDAETVAAIEIRRQRGFAVYGIVGEGIAEKHEPPPEWRDPIPNILESSWTTPKGEQMDWFFIPIAVPDLEKLDPMKKLIMYEPPRKGADYSLGIDTGQGVGGDRSVICVTKTGHAAFPDQQVAEFCCDDITNIEIYAYAAAICALYSRYMDETHAKICIEQRRKYGDTCQHQLILMGMRRHHIMIAYDRKTNKPKAGPHTRMGWYTGTWSRPMLLNMYKYAVENGWFIVQSKWLLGEMENFEQRETASGRLRMDHQHGQHDDRIFSAAMSYFTMHDLELMIERSKLKYNAASDDLEYIVPYTRYHYQAQPTSGEAWERLLHG